MTMITVARPRIPSSSPLRSFKPPTWTAKRRGQPRRLEIDRHRADRQHDDDRQPDRHAAAERRHLRVPLASAGPVQEADGRGDRRMQGAEQDAQDERPRRQPETEKDQIHAKNPPLVIGCIS